MESVLLKVAKMLKKKLGVEAFDENWYSDEKLTNYFKIPSTLIIPEGCMKIEQYAFDDNNKLEKVVIPEGCKWIGPYAFWGCRRLKKVVIPESVEEIKSCAFCGCNSATIILRKPKKDFKFISSEAFYNVRDVKEEIRS